MASTHTKYWEVIYQTGNMSVMSVDNEKDAKEALANHHLRALAGQPGGPTGAPAEPIKAVYEYEKHPHDLASPSYLPEDQVAKSFKETLKRVSNNGVVNIAELQAALSPPVLRETAGPHESKYNLSDEARTPLDLSFLPTLSSPNPGDK